MVEKHQRQPQQQDSSGGAQQPDHTLVNLLGNRAQIPGRGRGDGGGGRTGQTGGVQATGTFSDLCIHTRTNVLLPGNTLRGPGAPRCLVSVLEPVSSSR